MSGYRAVSDGEPQQLVYIFKMLTTALVAVAVASVVIYWWRKFEKANKFWDQFDVPTPPNPLPFFGHTLPLFSKTVSMHKMLLEFYAMFPDKPYFGIYQFMQPALCVKDPELIERVLIKDFQHFTDHAFISKEYISDPVDINLFNMEGNMWRAFRNKFSPLFTTGKLRHMVPQMKLIGETLIKALEQKTTGVDLRDMFQRFAMDIIGSTAYGIDINTIEEEGESEFRRLGKLAHQMTWGRTVRMFIVMIFPRIANFFKISPNHPNVNRYFSKILRETLELRRKSDMKRNDFVQLFLSLQQRGTVEFEGDKEDEYLKTEGNEKNDVKIEVTDDVLIGQAFLFFIAGFEATANGMMFLCYELAMNPEVQTKARNEVLRTVENRNGVLDYDTLREMTYLNQCVTEMLRLHTFLPMLFRVCTKDYTFPGTSISLKKGNVVFIPIVGIHSDPEYYEEPEKFLPERWDPDITRPNCTYLPFGDGPRVCIAMRFALTEVKLSVARVLLDFTVSINPKTILPMEMDRTNITSMPKNPVYFDLTTKANDDNN